jgi:hypothetical protein
LSDQTTSKCNGDGVQPALGLQFSAKRDNVQKYIAALAKDAADQCSGTRPAMLALNLADQLNREEFDDLLRTSSGIHNIAAAVFESDQRSHVNSIAFTAPQRARADGQGTISLAGDLAVLDNPKPKFTCAEIRSIFRKAG